MKCYTVVQSIERDDSARICKCLKGQFHKIFCFWFFSWISYHQAPDYTITVVSNFFVNSPRYSAAVSSTPVANWNRWQFAIDATSLTPVANLPPVSTTLAKQVANLPPVLLIPAAILTTVSLTPVANLPMVSLLPVVHLDLRISSRIFEKIRNGLNGILWGWGETDSWKKPEAKNLVTLTL